MKKINFLTMILAVIFVAFNLNAQDEKQYKEVNLKTTAQCGMCKDRLEKAINKMDGIIKTNLDLETKEMYVKYDPEEIELDDIKEKISRTGYNADEVKAKKRAYNKLPKCCQLGGHD